MMKLLTNYYLELIPSGDFFITLLAHLKEIKKFYGLYNNQIPMLPHVSLLVNFDIPKTTLRNVQNIIERNINVKSDLSYEVKNLVCVENLYKPNTYIIAYNIQLSKNFIECHKNIVSDLSNIVTFEFDDYTLDNFWYHMTIIKDLDKDTAKNIYTALCNSYINTIKYRTTNPIIMLTKNGNPVSGFSRRKRMWREPESFIPNVTKSIYEMTPYF